MAATDIVLASVNTKFTFAYRRLGLSPDAGGTYFLARDLGYRRALELYLTNDTIDAATALSLGLVTRVVPDSRLVEEASGLAQQIAAGPRQAQATTKRLFRQAGDGLLARQLDDEIRWLADNARCSDFAEGIRAFVEKREPRFNAEDAPMTLR
jgi:2-(1,2-epoxy-1,2-dihydrophenyl)acetyl-CoA isomerase